MRRLRLFTALDALLIVVLLLAGAAGMWWTTRQDRRRGAASPARWARVEVDGREVARLPLDQAGFRWVQGRYGKVLLETDRGRVRVKDLEPLCPDRICLRTGWSDRPGRPIVCVPNHLVVRVESPSAGKAGSTGEAGYDALAQ
ncbi:MAG TPA: NusG domain II-containing protein [Firmicutes bacterium]|nr:NusG domain II-containing protein [Bacillota bacterium]